MRRCSLSYTSPCFVLNLYKKARSGEIKYFTGIDDPYKIPLCPEVECKTNQESVAQSATKVLEVV
ncbi:adenylyl-sulfate kinase [Nostoc sp.]|uniref:adenylyl-sulfate kinase n=1 Tax=Nostoc sp. TaxID=1180 RepID=UPI003FA52C23